MCGGVDVAFVVGRREDQPRGTTRLSAAVKSGDFRGFAVVILADDAIERLEPADVLRVVSPARVILHAVEARHARVAEWAVLGAGRIAGTREDLAAAIAECIAPARVSRWHWRTGAGRRRNRAQRAGWRSTRFHSSPGPFE